MLSRCDKHIGLMPALWVAGVLVLCTASYAEETAPAMTPDQETQALSNADVVILTTSVIRLQRQYIVASAMALTEEEGAAFWPVYEAYWQEMGVLRDGSAKLIEDFVDKRQTLTEEEAAAMVREYLSLRESEVNIKQKYLKDFAAALPYKKVIRYYQIENKLDTILSYELAKQVPLIEPV